MSRTPQTSIKDQYIKTAAVQKKKLMHDRILKQAARQQAIYQRMSWRDYQKSLKQVNTGKRRLKRFFIVLILLLVSAWAVYAILPLITPEEEAFINIEKDSQPAIEATEIPPEGRTLPKPAEPESEETPGSPIGYLIDDRKLLNLTTQSLELNKDGHHYRAVTSLDPLLQSALVESFDKVNSRYIGIVAMEPETGRIIAFAGFNKTPADLNPCTTNKFPAASIFKIVTAAAAAEKFGYSGDTQLQFNGAKHTLYKKQLSDKENRFTTRISFRNSFAESVNPVFGKLGALRLGKETLEAFGKAFGFNRRFTTELNIAPSNLKVSDETYNQAEIASGFNRNTTLSPVHAAMIVSAALNGGKLVQPTIVDRVVDPTGKSIYTGIRSTPNQIISDRTSSVLKGMMEATVKSGTARKAFKGYTRDEVLKNLVIGGKTGSIYNTTHDARFDWFVGFAKTADLSEKVVISVVVAHEEFIGRRAGEYARIAFKTHFKNHFAKQEAKRRLDQNS